MIERSEFVRSELALTLAQRNSGAVHDPDYAALGHLPAGTPRVILDVGANRGQSIVTFKTLLPEADVHAFETNPAYIEVLEHVAAMYTGVKVHHHGLGATSCAMTLHVPSAGGVDYAEESSVRPDYFSREWVIDRFRGRGDLQFRHLTVTVMPGDLLGLSPDVIKVDVEGAEFEVLTGLAETIQRCRPTLLIENSDWDTVTAFLMRIGYRPFAWDAGAQAFTHFAGQETRNAFYLHGQAWPSV